MSLSESIEKAYCQFVGNRITCAAVLTGMAGINEAVTGNYPGGILLTYAAIQGLRVSETGAGTATYFEKADRHIKQYGTLHPRYMEGLIEKIENTCLLGYCQLQGIYLAARKHGELDTFNHVKKRLSNVILPNF